MSKEYTTAQEAAAQRIHDALASEFTVLGPNRDEDCDVAGEHPLLSEWVCVSNWVDDDNETWTVTFGSPGLSRTHRIGLLNSHWHD